MEWFFARLNTSSQCLFGYRDKQDHEQDFSKLLQLSLIKEVDTLRNIECDLCDEGHFIHPIPEEDGTFSLECDGGTRTVSNDEMKVWGVNQDALLSLIKKNLAIEGDVIEVNRGDKKLWKLGTKKGKHQEIHFYYLREDTALEFERLCIKDQDVHNVHNVVLTNTGIKDVPQKPNVQFITLPSLIDTKVSFFSVKKLDDAIVKVRRVQFDNVSGNLYLDGRLLHSLGKAGNEKKYFIEKLWKEFEKPVSNEELYQYVRIQKLRSGVEDTAQKWCNKVKSAILKACPDIANILMQPQQNEYMLKEPDR